MTRTKASRAAQAKRMKAFWSSPAGLKRRAAASRKAKARKYRGKLPITAKPITAATLDALDNGQRTIKIGPFNATEIGNVAAKLAALGFTFSIGSIEQEGSKVA